MQLIDTHVHINFDAFQADLDQIAEAWRRAGIVHLVHSCVDPQEFPVTQAIANRFPEVSFAVGLHPLDMDKWCGEATSGEIRSLAMSDKRVVAIGETGLDFFKATDYEVQLEAFRAQLRLARELTLPVIIHCREAARPMADLLWRFWQEEGPVTGVMHCWAGTPDETQWFLDLGFYVSFSGIVTFKNANTVKASAQMVPCDRILVETDCPFLTPEPCRKERRNQPAYVHHVANHVATLRGVSLETLAAQTTANAVRLFNLPISLSQSELSTTHGS
ncbi:D-aminoacyl-tRNA deacylase [Halomicronema hongdechloris C2206]|uniref:D-aminoacyl-tRNA deacylase n=1 Tax=Halomicronema hongdechloris C2206 TaxID=1641165 RepID=A0A1Z3HR08_9CYAN|nr:TatD family hydrolase [Halomicronema hongdechloris]ASC72759.1 D-aminoacyl-tRNA deacylase [Halomicronema hongdechloris C2206]